MQTLTALDNVDGGEGSDTLVLTSVAAVTSLAPAGSSVTGIESVAITSAGTVAADTTNWTGVANLTLVGIGNSSATAATTTDVVATVTAGDLAVTGGNARNGYIYCGRRHNFWVCG